MSQNYTAEYKKKIVRLHVEEGRTYKSITAEYGVSKASISKWCSEYNKECQTKAESDPDSVNELDSVFPGYGAIFSDIGGVSSRAILSACPTPQALLQKTEDELAGLINSASKRGEHFAQRKRSDSLKLPKKRSGQVFRLPEAKRQLLRFWMSWNPY